MGGFVELTLGGSGGTVIITQKIVFGKKMFFCICQFGSNPFQPFLCPGKIQCLLSFGPFLVSCTI